jgi:PAS domain S-box-containing protein
MLIESIPIVIAVVAVYQAVVLYKAADKKRKDVQKQTRDDIQLIFTSRLAFGTGTIAICYIMLGFHWIASDTVQIPDTTDLAWNALEALIFGFLTQSCVWARKYILARLDSVVIEKLNEKLRKKQAQIEAENDVLQLIAKGAAFFEVAQRISKHVESFNPKLLCSILMCHEDGKLYDFWSPSLSEDYKALMFNGFPPGPGNGACGAAAFHKDFFFCCDIETDENWTPFPRFQIEARLMGVRAVWSTAVLDSRDRLLGTVAFYSLENREPDHRCIALLNWSAHIAGIAIDKHKMIEGLREAREYRDALLRALPDLVFVHDVEGYYLDCYANSDDLLIYPCHQVVGKHISECFDQPMTEQILEMYRRVVRTRHPDRLEYDLEVRGNVRSFEARIVPLDGDKLLSTVRDVTDWKQAQYNLAQQLLWQREALRRCENADGCPGSEDGTCRKATTVGRDTPGLDGEDGTVQGMAGEMEGESQI